MTLDKDAVRELIRHVLPPLEGKAGGNHCWEPGAVGDYGQMSQAGNMDEIEAYCDFGVHIWGGLDLCVDCAGDSEEEKENREKLIMYCATHENLVYLRLDPGLEPRAAAWELVDRIPDGPRETWRDHNAPKKNCRKCGFRGARYADTEAGPICIMCSGMWEGWI